MTNLLSRKTRLILETPYIYQRRNIIAEVKAEGLSLRQKGRRTRLEISWGTIWLRAAEIQADICRKERAERRRLRKAGAR